MSRHDDQVSLKEMLSHAREKEAGNETIGPQAEAMKQLLVTRGD